METATGQMNREHQRVVEEERVFWRANHPLSPYMGKTMIIRGIKEGRLLSYFDFPSQGTFNLANCPKVNRVLIDTNGYGYPIPRARDAPGDPCWLLLPETYEVRNDVIVLSPHGNTPEETLFVMHEENDRYSIESRNKLDGAGL